MVSNQNPTSTKDKKVKEKVGTEEDESAPVDDMEEVQKRATPKRGKEQEIQKITFTADS